MRGRRRVAPRALVPIRARAYVFAEGALDAKGAILKISAAESLSRDEARSVMASVMSGEATPAQLGALLGMLQARGETVDEIAGFALAMRDASVRVSAPAGSVDTCGTGGDRSNTFNVSTVAAIVAAAAGARVAKHGNRAASSACGSADVLEALGVAIDLGPEQVRECLDQVGIAFMFAPRYHPAMKHAAPVRRELGFRTIFNILGPLANPAGVRRQLVGVPSLLLGETLAAVLLELGVEHALVVAGEGLDEMSPAGRTASWEVRNGSVSEGRFEPEDLGLARSKLSEIRGGDAQRNAVMAREVLDGRDGGPRTAVLMNAGAALYLAGMAGSVREGVGAAARAIDDGRAAERLARFVATTQRLAAAG